MSTIIEASENMHGEAMLTIQATGGQEYILNGDVAVRMLVDLFAEIDNERQHGRQLSAPWFEVELEKLKAAAFKPVPASR